MVCSQYFEEYTEDLENIKTITKQMEEKYNNWSKVLIQPQATNDARLFALENRFSDSDKLR